MMGFAKLGEKEKKLVLAVKSLNQELDEFVELKTNPDVDPDKIKAASSRLEKGIKGLVGLMKKINL